MLSQGAYQSWTDRPARQSAPFYEFLNENWKNKILNAFFSNVVTNLNIPRFHQIDRTSENISDAVIRAIVKYIGPIQVLLPSKKTVLLNLILSSRVLRK